jgi:hypothetical protein
MNTSGFQGRLKRANLEAPGMAEDSVFRMPEHACQLDRNGTPAFWHPAPRFLQMLGSLIRAARSRVNS